MALQDICLVLILTISPSTDLDLFSYTNDINWSWNTVIKLFKNTSCKSITGASGDLTEGCSFLTSTLILQPYCNNIQLIDILFKNDFLARDFNREAVLGNFFKILDTFDFTVCKAAILPDLTCIVHRDFFEHETKRILHITNCSNSIISRIYKYIKLGYSLDEESYIEVLSFFNKNIRKLDPLEFQSFLNNFIKTGDPFLSDFAEDIYKRWLSSKNFLK